jgi:FkbM family methyltransferase
MNLKTAQNMELTEKLNSSLNFYQTSLLNRILGQPNRMLYSIAISLMSSYFDLAVSAKAMTFFGKSMKVILPENVSTTIYRYGYFEEGLATFILQYLKPGMICFDIGTHFGFFTLLFSHLVGESGQVHAFEPTKSTFEILKENTKDRSNIFLNNQAVWSEETSISFNDYGVGKSAYNSIYEARWIDKSSKSTYKVEALSIDSYIHKTGIVPNFIKIDAESAEYEILMGMEKTLAEFKPIVTLEVGDMGIGEAISSKNLIAYMLERGYQALEFKNGRIENHILSDNYDYSNIFFIPH